MLGDALGILGVLAYMTGMLLLWQSRHEIADWVAAFNRSLRAHLAQQPAPRPRAASRHALRIALGMSFLLIGPLLIAVGLYL